jgi:ubiquinone/menaquinone biosynthesis C-methylase UbiE
MAARADPTYTLGVSDGETRRLIAQSALIDRPTQRFLEDAGIAPGMRVLEVGSGAGDVAIAAARLVGPSGVVAGVDRNGAILATARRRAAEADLANLTFVEADLREIPVDGAFDAVVGRFVLLYVADPAEALRGLVERLRPGGIVAFMELLMSMVNDYGLRHPELGVYNRCMSWVARVLEASGTHPNLGADLPRLFRRAGLSSVRLSFSAPMFDADDVAACVYVAETLRSVVPLLEKYRIATAAEVDPDTLAERLRRELVQTGTPTMVLPTVWAAARKPT